MKTNLVRKPNGFCCLFWACEGYSVNQMKTEKKFKTENAININHAATTCNTNEA